MLSLSRPTKEVLGLIFCIRRCSMRNNDDDCKDGNGVLGHHERVR